MKTKSTKYPSGTNKSLESLLEKERQKYKDKIERTKYAYKIIYDELGIHLEKQINNLRENNNKVYKDNLYWLSYLIYNERGIVSLEEAIIIINEYLRRDLAKIEYNYVKRITNRDNKKGTYNSGNGYSQSSIRIPSLKRSNTVWKNFYELFPWYKEHYSEIKKAGIIKLKKVW